MGGLGEEVVLTTLLLPRALNSYGVFCLCSKLSRIQPAKPRAPPNCLVESTAPVCASTITLEYVFFPLGMMAISYSARLPLMFISPEPIWPGTAHSATRFAWSGEIIVAGSYMSVFIWTFAASPRSMLLHEDGARNQ